MFLGLLTLLTALVISSVAIYYSVSGLTAIFAGAAIPIMVMGTVLEVGKLVVASWLHHNWKTAPILLRSYFIIATFVLMIITSMGIFGFLSRAHIEQGAPVGDVSAQIELIDGKIAGKKNEITQAQTAVKNLDEVVAQYLLKGKDEKSVAAANNARRNQQKERDKLAKQIDDAQTTINKLSEEKAPLTTKVRKIETEVGPIKYIAAFIYGSNPSGDLLEKAVTWMIMIIIFVFDPLAVLLLIASQMSLTQASVARKLKREEKLKAKEPVIVETPVVIPLEEPKKVEEIIIPVPINNPVEEVPIVLKKVKKSRKPAKKKEKKIVDETAIAVPTTEVLAEAIAEIKKEEAKKIEELAEPIIYIQNSEQTDNTLWNRVQANRKIFKPMDILYSEYYEHGFKDIDLSNHDQTNPEIQMLTKYVDDIKNGVIKFDDIPLEHREKLAELITSDQNTASNVS